MKKLVVAVIITVFSVTNMISQEDSFGVSVGYSSMILKAKVIYAGDFESDSESAAGFYIGFFKEFDINEKFTIRPEFQYAMYIAENENSSMLFVPVMFQYEVAEYFSLMAGPKFDYILDDDTDELNQLGLGISFGAEVDLLPKLFLNLKYSFGISERLKDDEILEPHELDLRLDTFNLGLGYRF